MSVISLGIYEKAFPENLSMSEMLCLAKESGYDFFEISIDRSDKRINRVFCEEETDRIKKAIEYTGFPIEHIGLSALSQYTLGNSDRDIQLKGIEIFKKTVIFAKKIGGRLIQIPACDTPKFVPRDEETDQRYIYTLKKLIEFAAKEGVMVALENMEEEYSGTVERCSRIVDLIGSPYLKLYPDSGNVTNASRFSKKTILEDMQSGKGQYVAFHLKEVRNNKYGGLYYGEGIVDFPTIVHEAFLLGARRFVMEYWYTGNTEWKEDLINAKNKFWNWLEINGE